MREPPLFVKILHKYIMNMFLKQVTVKNYAVHNPLDILLTKSNVSGI